MDNQVVIGNNHAEQTKLLRKFWKYISDSMMRSFVASLPAGTDLTPENVANYIGFPEITDVALIPGVKIFCTHCWSEIGETKDYIMEDELLTPDKIDFYWRTYSEGDALVCHLCSNSISDVTDVTVSVTGKLKHIADAQVKLDSKNKILAMRICDRNGREIPDSKCIHLKGYGNGVPILASPADNTGIAKKSLTCDVFYSE